MTNGERIETCSKAYEALTVLTGAIMTGDEDTAKQYLDELYTYIDDLYDVYHEYQDDDDDDDDEEDYDDEDDDYDDVIDKLEHNVKVINEDLEEVSVKHNILVDRVNRLYNKVDLLTRLFNK